MGLKFAARLQEYLSGGEPPGLIRLEINTDHGAGTALDRMIEAGADERAFLKQPLGF